MVALMGPKGKAEGCLMPEYNMAVKRFFWLNICQGLDVNLCFVLKGGGETCVHIEWKQVFEQKTDSG